jgi:hypothetical protein
MSNELEKRKEVLKDMLRGKATIEDLANGACNVWVETETPGYYTNGTGKALSYEQIMARKLSIKAPQFFLPNNGR